MSEIKKFKTNVFTYKLVREKSRLPKVSVTSSRVVYEFVRPVFEDCMETNERMVMIVLNQANNVMGYKIISEGGMTGTLVDVRLCLRYTLQSGGVAAIFVHNHPSGALKPSQSDKTITKKLKESFALMDLQVLDHLIITEDSYLSFADEGIL